MTPVRFLAALLAALLLIGTGAAGAFAAYGPDRVWTDLFGDPDTGPYDFDLPTRTGKMNDALACPPDACTGVGEVLPTPLFPVAPDLLLAEARARLEALPGTRVVAEAPDRLAFRAVVRTPLLRFPDTVTVEVRRTPAGPSALRVYSRSKIGYADLGTNARRVAELVAGLAERLPNRPPIPAAALEGVPSRGPGDPFTPGS